LKFAANSIVEWVRTKTKKPDLDAGQALNFGWTKLLKIKKLDKDELSKEQASDLLKEFTVGSQSDLDQIFKNMSTWNSGNVGTEELHEKLHAHATGTAPPVRPPPVTLDSTI
jgi:D-mannonate dehydratase